MPNTSVATSARPTAAVSDEGTLTGVTSPAGASSNHMARATFR
jgi:hypothetical protein